MQLQSCILILAAVSVLVVPVLADDDSGQMNSAGALYSKSVDLANAGNYRDALAAADQALALNVSSTIPLIQANRAGILVMLNRYDEAVAAADVAIGNPGNIPVTKSIAWYNKGNALRALGRISEARTAYETAHSIDSSFEVPDMSSDTIASGKATAVVSPPTNALQSQPLPPSPVPTTRAPVSLEVGILGILAALICYRCRS